MTVSRGLDSLEQRRTLPQLSLLICFRLRRLVAAFLRGGCALLMGLSCIIEASSTPGIMIAFLLSCLSQPFLYLMDKAHDKAALPAAAYLGPDAGQRLLKDNKNTRSYV